MTDAEKARQALGEEVAAAMRFLAEGFDFRVYTAGSLVLRFPKRDEVAGWVAAEAALLQALAPVLPAPVPRPRLGLSFAVYAYLPGVSGDEIVPGAGLAAELGAFLAALHAFSPEIAASLGAPHRRDEWRPSAYLDFVRSQASGRGGWRAPLDAALAARCDAFLDAAPPDFAAPMRVIHGDLEAEHVLCDAQSGALAGVIDWADISIADPARDLASMWAWGGTRFLEALLAAYPAPDDPGLRARIPFLGRCYALSDWIEAAGDGERRRAFARGQLERVFQEDLPA